MPGEKKLQCVVVTPEKTLFDEWVDFVALPLYDGEAGVLPGRTPLIGRLGFGELRTKTGEVVKRYFIDGGFVQVRADVVTVLTNRAVPAQDLDAAAAAKELEAAGSQTVTSESEFAEQERAIARRAARSAWRGTRVDYAIAALASIRTRMKKVESAGSAARVGFVQSIAGSQDTTIFNSRMSRMARRFLRSANASKTC